MEKSAFAKLSKFSKITLIVAVLLLAFIATTIWAILTVPKPPTKEEAKELAQRIMVYENNTMTEEQNGRVVWEITAKRSEVNSQTNDAKCVGVSGKFYTKNGLTIDGYGDRGGYNGRTKDVTLEGNAVLLTSDGKKLTADQIVWVAAKETAIATGHVHVTSPDLK